MPFKTKQETWFSQLPFWIRFPFNTWLIIGVLPFLTKRIGFPYLPSSEWVSQTYIPAIAFGFTTTLFLFVMVHKNIQVKDQKMTDFKHVLAIFFMPMFGFLIGYSATVMGAPMIVAATVGSEIEVPFTVVEFDGSSRRCKNPITLDGLPWMNNMLCGQSKEFRRSLEVNGQIIVVGRGTAMGVFSHSARKTEPQ